MLGRSSARVHFISCKTVDVLLPIVNSVEIITTPFLLVLEMNRRLIGRSKKFGEHLCLSAEQVQILCTILLSNPFSILFLSCFLFWYEKLTGKKKNTDSMISPNGFHYSLKNDDCLHFSLQHRHTNSLF